MLVNTEKLNNVEIDPNNKNFQKYNDEFILGKTEENIEIFDSIIFARRNLEKVTISSFIKKINSCAFSGCTKLQTIEILSDSELQIIEEGAFENTIIESIFIPCHVKQIDDQIFGHNCKYLKNIYFEDNSELSAINFNAFSGTLIENLTIPENVCNIKECLSLNGSNIKLNIDSKNKHIINYKDEFILGKTDTNKEIFDIICLTQRKFEKVTIPTFIKRINSCAFIRSTNLRFIDIPIDSELQ